MNYNQQQILIQPCNYQNDTELNPSITFPKKYFVKDCLM